MPDMAVGIYDLVISFDQLDRRMWLISTGIPETSPTARKKRAADRIGIIRKYLRLARPMLETPEIPHTPDIMPWQSNFDRVGYEGAVQTVVDYIHAGDIFRRICRKASGPNMPMMPSRNGLTFIVA